MATLPIEATGWLSKWGLKVVPSLSVLKRPPAAVATKNRAGLPGVKAISLIRPPMFAGPIARQARLRIWSDENRLLEEKAAPAWSAWGAGGGEGAGAFLLAAR